LESAVVENVEPSEGAGRWRALALLGTAELLGMSLWFSASAVAPALRAEWRLSESATSWLTLSVQLGFVAGTLLSALLNLPDVISSRHLFTVSAIAGAVVNAVFALFAHSFGFGVTLRFLVGACLAGVYPPGMKGSKKRVLIRKILTELNGFMMAVMHQDIQAVHKRFAVRARLAASL
jgi:MFS family permease